LDATTFQVITPSNPAARGSIILVYITGAGQTTPVGNDGQVTTGLPLPLPRGTVTATIGGSSAEVLYAGGSVGLVEGGIQLNVRIPSSIAPGNQALVVNVGSASSAT